jgi:hypothetical protein
MNKAHLTRLPLRLVTALELAERWRGLPRLTPEEMAAFAADIAASLGARPSAPLPSA